jgi:hypothetical protein
MKVKKILQYGFVGLGLIGSAISMDSRRSEDRRDPLVWGRDGLYCISPVTLKIYYDQGQGSGHRTLSGMHRLPISPADTGTYINTKTGKELPYSPFRVGSPFPPSRELISEALAHLDEVSRELAAGDEWWITVENARAEKAQQRAEAAAKEQVKERANKEMARFGALLDAQLAPEITNENARAARVVNKKRLFNSSPKNGVAAPKTLKQRQEEARKKAVLRREEAEKARDRAAARQGTFGSK